MLLTCMILIIIYNLLLTVHIIIICLPCDVIYVPLFLPDVEYINLLYLMICILLCVVNDHDDL